MALVVAAAGLGLAFGQRLDGLALPQVRPVDQDQAALRGAGRIIGFECHFLCLPVRAQTPVVTSIDWPSARRPIAFFTSLPVLGLPFPPFVLPRSYTRFVGKDGVCT